MTHDELRRLFGGLRMAKWQPDAEAEAEIAGLMMRGWGITSYSGEGAHAADRQTLHIGMTSPSGETRNIDVVWQRPGEARVYG